MSNKMKPRKVAERTSPAAAPASGPKSEQEVKELKAEQDELLTEALEETFPASDPMSSLRFT